MSAYLSEFLGTMLLILLGDGVCCAVSLNKSKAQNSGWIVIAFGWALAVAIPVYIFGPIGGAHFNPAVTLGMAAIGKIAWSMVPGYIGCQMAGAILGAVLVYLMYKPHFDVTEDKATKLGVFCTAPAIKDTPFNFISEFIGTFVLVFTILGVSNTTSVDGFGPFIVGLIILVIGLSLGATTGYAINPARDLGPRIAHAILPIKDKGDSDWGYAWLPVIAPICGGICAALIFTLLF